LEPDSNITEERDLAPEKQRWPTVSTEQGMQIDDSERQSWRAFASIRESLERRSNVTDESDLQSEKHDSPSVSTEDGIEIDPRNRHPENASFSMRESLA
jgi:hypothetical protein